MGSPRLQGNTASLLKPIIARLKERGAEVEYITLADKKIEPCVDCRVCQDVLDSFGCPLQDDTQEIFDAVLRSDCIVWATPIYSWSCTTPMKSVLDRFVRGMNKYYGKIKGPCHWEGKRCALVTTSGYNVEYAAGPFEESLMRYCKHSRLKYIGKLGIRDKGSVERSIDETAVAQARGLADQIYFSCLPEAGGDD
jgi:multimeric flavodoxin WrbA